MALASGLLAWAVLWSGPAAAQNCDSPATPSDVAECANLRLRAAQRELNDVYGALLESEDKDFAAAVRKAQEAWVLWRDAESALAGRAAGSPAEAVVVRRKLEAQMTEDRVKDLRSYSGY